MVFGSWFIAKYRLFGCVQVSNFVVSYFYLLIFIYYNVLFSWLLNPPTCIHFYTCLPSSCFHNLTPELGQEALVLLNHPGFCQTKISRQYTHLPSQESSGPQIPATSNTNHLFLLNSASLVIILEYVS